MQKWIAENSEILGIVMMILLSSTAAYLKEFEKANVQWTMFKHLMTWFTKCVYAGFAAMLIWSLAQTLIKYGWNIPAPAVPFVMGVAGYSGAQFLDFLGVTLMDWIRKRAGLSKNTEGEK